MTTTTPTATAIATAIATATATATVTGTPTGDGTGTGTAPFRSLLSFKKLEYASHVARVSYSNHLSWHASFLPTRSVFFRLLWLA